MACSLGSVGILYHQAKFLHGEPWGSYSAFLQSVLNSVKNYPGHSQGRHATDDARARNEREIPYLMPHSSGRQGSAEKIASTISVLQNGTGLRTREQLSPRERTCTESTNYSNFVNWPWASTSLAYPTTSYEWEGIYRALSQTQATNRLWEREGHSVQFYTHC